MIPAAEHWRLPLSAAQELQHAIMGYLPGFATPRIICDVPYVGKRWVHQVAAYDGVRRHLLPGRRTTGPASTSLTRRAGSRRYHYYDPVHTLPAERAALVGALVPAGTPGPGRQSLASGAAATSGGRASYGVLNTTVVRVATSAVVRISVRSDSRSAASATRTLRM